MFSKNGLASFFQSNTIEFGPKLGIFRAIFPFIVAVSNKNMNILLVHQSIIPLQLYYILCIRYVHLGGKFISLRREGPSEKDTVWLSFCKWLDHCAKNNFLRNDAMNSHYRHILNFFSFFIPQLEAVLINNNLLFQKTHRKVTVKKQNWQNGIIIVLKKISWIVVQSKCFISN